MSDGWFPDAIRDPGKNVNYRRGRTTNQLDVAHFTVGRDSRALIRDQGLAAFLFPKVGRPFQFCQADSVTAHACEWNTKGCGYEVERLSWDEGFTPDQTRWVGEVLRWRNREYGVPLVLYTGPRLPVGSGYRGVANHGSLVHHACDQHTDGWTAAEFAAAIGATPTPPTGMENDMYGIQCSGRGWFIKDGPTLQPLSQAQWTSLTSGAPRYTWVDMTPEQFDALKADLDRLVPKPANVTTGDVTVNIDYDAMADAVRRGVNAAETS